MQKVVIFFKQAETILCVKMKTLPEEQIIISVVIDILYIEVSREKLLNIRVHFFIDAKCSS